MERIDKNKKKSEREKEIAARIVRDNPQPISIGNGVHREDSILAQKESREQATKRTKREDRNS